MRRWPWKRATWGLAIRPFAEHRESRLGFSNEEELIARLRARDLDALGELYRELGGAMTTLARTMLRDADEAADVVEDALLRVRDAAPGFRGTRGLRTWVLRIVANRCRDLLRRRRFTAGRPEDFDPIAEAGLRSEPLASWDEGIDQARLLVVLERAIDALPPEQREAVVLRDRLGLSYEEAAETLGVSVAAIKSRLFRARASLREALKPMAEG
jgi:RNA polymerase sigma-70 factor, ECF subfamily